jgi:hypothetical protein
MLPGFYLCSRLCLNGGVLPTAHCPEPRAQSLEPVQQQGFSSVFGVGGVPVKVSKALGMYCNCTSIRNTELNGGFPE